MLIMSKVLVNLWFVFVLLILSAFTATGQQQCSQRWACIDVEKATGGSVNFYLHNKKNYAITMTLTVEPENLTSLVGNVVTKTVEGGERILAMNYRPLNRLFDTNYRYTYHWAVGRLDVVHDDQYLYRLPYNNAAGPYVVQGFNGGYSHRGFSQYSVDFAMPNGSEIYAAREGVVVDVESRNNRGGASRRYARYANFIVIEHSDGSTGEYYHLLKSGVFVRPGDNVKRGQLIGLSGSTGFTSLPHLHFAVYKAVANGDTQSLPIRFLSAAGIVQNPRSGHRYKVEKAD
jgi:murein DD-endopeptidase MepM/ murein hydrolase activator NlpD